MAESRPLPPILFVVLGGVVFGISLYLDSIVDSSFMIFIVAGVGMFLYGIVRFFIGHLRADDEAEVAFNKEVRKEIRSPVSAQNYQQPQQIRPNPVNPASYRHTSSLDDEGYHIATGPARFCPSCGARVSQSNFCPVCGTRLH